MDFEKLVQVYEKLENTSSGNAMREILAEFFKTVPTEDIRLVAYLTLGQLSSDYEGTVLGLAEKSVLKAITVAGGKESSKVRKLMQTSGDVGLVAEEVLKNKPMTLIPLGKLTIHELEEKLKKVATLSGSGSSDQKTNILAGMLQKASAKGAKYLARISLGTLRMGVAAKTIIDSLAIAFTGDKSNKVILETAYNICPDIGIIAETLATKGLDEVKKTSIQVGIPIQMMLGQRVKSLEHAQEKIPGKLTVEAKYDGERVQAHMDKDGNVHLFSRRLESISEQFPDLVEHLKRAIKAKECILEGEVLAIDKKGNPLPFQTLMQRRRKYDVDQYVKDIPIQFKVFDLLYLDGESWLNQPYYKRSEKLSEIVQKDTEVTLTERIITDDVKEIDVFFRKMLKSGYEGIFIKSRAEDSYYQAGVRGWNWIKWKKEYVQEMVDTFDLAIVGGFYGKGKRSGGYGALLCATYNHDNDTFETFCKLGTGLTDELIAELPEKLKQYKVDKKPARLVIKKEMHPDVWFEPGAIVEVFGAEITKSPFHTCGSGLALRFPRLIQFRENKNAEQANTSKEVEELV
jgi:DNA ligase 1